MDKAQQNQPRGLKFDPSFFSFQVRLKTELSSSYGIYVGGKLSPS